MKGRSLAHTARFSVYQVFFHVRRDVEISVGRLGRIAVRAGSYFYTGSAKRALYGRLRRHLRRSKKAHWHIDHLLACPSVEVGFVLACRGEAVGGECGLHRRGLERLGASEPIAGFGSSDCKAGCRAHLAHLRRSVRPDEVLERYGLADDGESAAIIWPADLKSNEAASAKRPRGRRDKRRSFGQGTEGPRRPKTAA